LTGGVLGCSGCGTGLTLGIGGDTKVGELPFGSGRDGSRVVFTLNGDLGYGQPSGTTFSHGSVLSGAVGLPISLVAGRRGADEMLFVPFITPGFGFGEIRSQRVEVVTPGGIITSEDSPSGSRFMLGGGVTLYNRSSNVGFDLGFQYVPVQQGQVLIGVGVSIGGR